ncbi:hypothetical protein FRC02_007675 [Tulasnella sp. 418]|nr:hypothetical protein FRC02_007675 [Tulasnella sp. 418]
MDSADPSSTLADVQDFYLQQQHWLASQKQQQPSLLSSAEPLDVTSLHLSTTDWTQAFAQHFQPRTTILSHSKLKQRHRRLAARRLSLRSHSPRLIVAARIHHYNPQPTPITPPSSAATTLLDMYENIVSSRMESCKRLEAIVQDAEQRRWYEY